MNELTLYFLLFLSMIVQVIVPPLPAEAIVIGAARAYGFGWTAFAAGSGLWAGSVMVFYAGRYIEEKFHRFFSKEKIETVLKRLKRHENLLLWIRVLPYNPSDVISYAAGILKVRPQKYIWISCCTSYLRCAMLARLGIHLEDLSHLLQILGLLGISALVAGIVVFGRKKKE